MADDLIVKCGPYFVYLCDIYTPLFPVFIRKCSAQLYAQDTKIFYSFHPDLIRESYLVANNDFKAIKKISREHLSHLNPSKCVAMLLGRRVDVDRSTPLMEINIINLTM